jgi:hypothetical protein
MDPNTPPLEEPGRAGRRLSAVFFATTFLLLLAFSPGHIAQMGYTPEILEAGRRLLDRGEAILNGMPGVQGEILVPRHGFGELVAALPFLTAARIAFGSSAEWANRALSLQPVLSTALICTVLFAWTRRLTGSAAWGVALGLLAGFSTMLWPYAYIGLETTQSLFLLLAGFLALEADGPPNWPRSLLFAACSAAAVSIKTASVFLVPALAWLAWCLFRPDSLPIWERRTQVRLKFLVVAFTVAAVWTLNTWTRVQFWRGIFKVGWLVAGPMDFLLQVWSALLSVNKGLLVFCPLLIPAILCLEVAFSTHRRLVTFAVLVLSGQLLGICLLFFWSDETWGPRYLHSSVAPLVLCLAVAKAGRPFSVRREMPLLSLGAAGTLVALLGSLFWYGYLSQAAGPPLLSTIENYQYDIDFNHIRFNARLARVWLDNGRDGHVELWPPHQKIWYTKGKRPPRFRPRRQVSLRPFAIPQPALLAPEPPLPRAVWLTALVLGTAGVGWLVRFVWRAEPPRLDEARHGQGDSPPGR